MWHEACGGNKNASNVKFSSSNLFLNMVTIRNPIAESNCFIQFKRVVVNDYVMYDFPVLQCKFRYSCSSHEYIFAASSNVFMLRSMCKGCESLTLQNYTFFILTNPKLKRDSNISQSHTFHFYSLFYALPKPWAVQFLGSNLHPTSDGLQASMKANDLHVLPSLIHFFFKLRKDEHESRLSKND